MASVERTTVVRPTPGGAGGLAGGSVGRGGVDTDPDAPVGAVPVVSMSDTDIALTDGDSISTSFSVSGDWNDGNADSSLEFVTTHWTTDSSGGGGGTHPSFPGGNWATIGSFTSFIAWDDGTEQPPDGAFVYTGEVIADFSDPFQDDGGGNWVRVEVTAIGPGGTSDPFVFYFQDFGI